MKDNNLVFQFNYELLLVLALLLDHPTSDLSVQFYLSTLNDSIIY